MKMYGEPTDLKKFKRPWKVCYRVSVTRRCGKFRWWTFPIRKKRDIRLLLSKALLYSERYTRCVEPTGPN